MTLKDAEARSKVERSLFLQESANTNLTSFTNKRLVRKKSLKRSLNCHSTWENILETMIENNLP
jgi:hypothetical protein